MRRFEVWLRAGSYRREAVVEMPDDATDEDCDDACKTALDALIEGIDTGWRESPEETE